MARGPDDDRRVVELHPGRLAAASGGPHDPGMEARVAKLEAAVEHLQSDVTEVKAVLGRIEPRIFEMAGALPHLATKADLAKRPTVAGIIAIVAAVAPIASMPIWPGWVAAIKAIASVTH